ncbi:DUF6406 domain-containing protein [Nocardiopsis suaedae]|uniref:Copper resistance protein CopC n=1 Tax=Nocardiopsis suaedae TaxID=3018444 RepID=A0ABT4TKF4_9ACTN|nr:DUF6406 domain-containing protein [Nocardiopsis suaedae]MDA2805178.1 hypothetical protein [Nocardiopsis suaedae]
MIPTPARRAVRALPAALLAAAVALGAAACAGDAETDTASVESEAPDLGQNQERVRLTEGAPVSMETRSGAMAAVQMTGHEPGDDPQVTITVTAEGGEAEEYTLPLGGELDVAGDRWRVSEIGLSDTRSQPSSTTLTRADDASGGDSGSGAASGGDA